MEWYRAYHGACSDAKWPIVARKAKVSVGVVVSVWFALLESASQASERGSVENFDPETVDALYGYEDGTTAAVFSAMLEKGLICDGRICAWDKRQPKREREDNSAARVRQFREKQRRETQTEATEAQDSASVTPCNASVTPPEQNREEQTREEDNNTPLTPQRGERGRARRAPSPDSIPALTTAVEEYTSDDGLREALLAFIAMRTKIRKPLTGRALQISMRKLDELAGDDVQLKIRILDQSVQRSWQGLFQLRDDGGQQQGQQEDQKKLSWDEVVKLAHADRDRRIARQRELAKQGRLRNDF